MRTPAADGDSSLSIPGWQARHGTFRRSPSEVREIGVLAARHPDPGDRFLLLQYCASFLISGRSVAIVPVAHHALATDGIPAEADFVA